jgi:prevent-host-death family protein
MERIIPISDLQSKAKRYVDQVRKTEEPVIITQRGRACAVLVSYEVYEGHQATREEMASPDWKTRLNRAHEEIHKGRGVELETYMKRRASRLSK